MQRPMSPRRAWSSGCARFGKTFSSAASKFFPPRPATAAMLPDLKYGYGLGKHEVDGRIYIAENGFDPDKRTCLILAHHFEDCPHCYPNSLFDDYYQSLVATLTFASNHPDINWLVRQHPYEMLLQRDNTFASVTERFQDARHIHVVSNKLAISSFFGAVGLVTTVNGSGGLEFAAAGTRPVLAGNPFYGELVFAVRPKTRETYCAALLELEYYKPLPEWKVQQAKEAAITHLHYKRVWCCRIPRVGDLAAEAVTNESIDDYWHEAAELSKVPIANDSLYDSVKWMMQTGNSVLVNTSLART